MGAPGTWGTVERVLYILGALLASAARLLKLFGLPGLGAGQADGIGRGDRYLTNSSWALLPFGFSLSYTSFSVGLALGC